MPNLLPKQSKKNIRQEYRLRVVIIILIFTLSATLIGLVFLIPSYALLKIEYDDRLKKKENIASSIKATQGDNYITALGDTTTKVSILRRGRDDTPLLATITKVINQKISGISLSSIDYLSASDGLSHLTLIGQAKTRDILINFKNNIQTEKSFIEVNHSIADLVKVENLSFTFDIKGNF